jgi:hypothetical protein
MIIIKLRCDGEDYYLEWNIYIKAPVTAPMTLKEFRSHCLEHCSNQGLADLPGRLKLTEKKGTSCVSHKSVDATLKNNKCGDDDSCLTRDQIIEKFIRVPRGLKQ